MLYAARSHIGLVRQLNEDSYALCSDGLPYEFVVVADGMGGASAGEVASRMAVESLSAAFKEAMQQGEFDVYDMLHLAIDRANHEIFTAGRDDDEYLGMGTTVVTLLLEPEQLIVAHVGDSRGYLLTKQGIEQITDDHTLVAELFRRGQITEDEALNHPQRHFVTRSLGTLEYTKPDIRTMSWTTGDVALICSDGLSNVVSMAQIEEKLREIQESPTQQDMERVADELLRLALVGGGPDNITFVLAMNVQGGVRE